MDKNRLVINHLSESLEKLSPTLQIVKPYFSKCCDRNYLLGFRNLYNNNGSTCIRWKALKSKEMSFQLIWGCLNKNLLVNLVRCQLLFRRQRTVINVGQQLGSIDPRVIFKHMFQKAFKEIKFAKLYTWSQIKEIFHARDIMSLSCRSISVLTFLVKRDLKRDSLQCECSKPRPPDKIFFKFNE